MNQTKSAFVAIIGRPNVGKSSLINCFIGEKIAIVSDKPQTTRTKITGILTQEETQLVFMDTPGFHKPRTKLSEYMLTQVSQSVADVDVTLLVVEPKKEIYKGEEMLLENITAKKLPCILVVNKIDQSEEGAILETIRMFSERYDFDHIVPISALKGENIDTLLSLVRGYAVDGPHYFPDDQFTDQPEKVIVAEMVREKVLLNMREEVPHGVGVYVESFKEREDGGMIDIHVTILCERPGHKGMIIGKQGAMLKKIASEARTDIEAFLDAKINLQCWVKIKDDWRNRESVMRSLGYQ